jgi:hypothetical protein
VDFWRVFSVDFWRVFSVDYCGVDIDEYSRWIIVTWVLTSNLGGLSWRGYWRVVSVDYRGEGIGE